MQLERFSGLLLFTQRSQFIDRRLCIISAENRVDTGSATVRFNLKPYKVFLFDRESEARVLFDTILKLK